MANQIKNNSITQDLTRTLLDMTEPQRKLNLTPTTATTKATRLQLLPAYKNRGDDAGGEIGNLGIRWR